MGKEAFTSAETHLFKVSYTQHSLTEASAGLVTV